MKFVVAMAALLGIGAALVAQTGHFVVTQGFAVTAGKPDSLAGKKPWKSPVECPEGVEAYSSTTWTQSIFVLNGRDTIRRVPIRGIERKWHQSGGMEGVEGFKSEKFRLIPKGKRVRYWVGDIPVKNRFGHFQNNRGILREYPDGTRFDDVLTNTKTGEVFEHRTRTKEDGAWYSEISYANEAARPDGYTGLKVSCGSCHGQAGTGEYDAGLVPGGDGNLSEPLDWSLVGENEEPVSRLRSEAPVRVQQPPRVILSAPAMMRNCPT